MEDFLNSLNFDLDLSYYYRDGQTFEEFEEEILDSIRNEEIIYCAKAMEYLTKNDTSLNESLEIASQMGFECSNLNSEILATLLYQQQLTEDWYEISSEIEERFEDVEESEEA